jgi:hypothetical protein
MNRNEINEHLRGDIRPMYPLSCYGLIAGHENLYDGDISPEELRWEAYQALARGALPEHSAQVNQMIAEAQQRWQAVLQNPLEFMNRAVAQSDGDGGGGDGGMDDGSSSSNVSMTQQQQAANLFGPSSSAVAPAPAAANLFGPPAGNTGGFQQQPQQPQQQPAMASFAQQSNPMGFAQQPPAGAAGHTYVLLSFLLRLFVPF